VLDGVVSTTFEHGHRAENIAVDVGERVLDAVAHARLRAEMHDAGEPLGGEQLGHALAIGKVDLGELEVGIALEDSEACHLQRDIVVLVEVVETHNLITALEQRFGCVKTDEACGSCNE
jgi:hypothetical protein